MASSYLSLTRRRLLLAPFLLLPGVALAHTGHEPGFFLSGVLHPISGLDHVLAMLAVGVLAGRMKARAAWLLPGSFLLMMMVGGMLGVVSAGLPLVETFIALSLVAFGACVAMPRQLSAAIASVIVGAFALFHGYAHGSEMATGGSVLSYGAGFMMATTLLLACGWRVTQIGAHTAEWAPRAYRMGGAAVALAGVVSLGVGV